MWPALLLLASLNLARADGLTMRGDGADPRIQHGIDLIYQLRYDEASNYFERIVAQDPDNPTGYFFAAMVGWWRVLIDLDDRSHDDDFYALLERCIEVCDARLAEDPDDFDAILFKGGAVGFRGRLRGDRHQYMRAARDGLRSLPLLRKSRELEPTNKDILFGQGIYNYFAEVMPKKHPVVRPVMWFLDDGDRELGLQQLRQVATEGRYARAEALYFLAQIYRLFEEDDARALPHLETLHQMYPGNALFHRYRARTLVSLGRWTQAAQLYEQVVSRSRGGQVGYHTRGLVEALYILGRNAFRQRRYERAATLFTEADAASRRLGAEPEQQVAGGYTALANLYHGMSLDQLQSPASARQAYDRVLALPNQGTSHDRARQYRKTPYQR